MFARVVKIIFDLAVDREPVNMYVGCRHENGYLYPFVLEIFRFYGSFYDHHFAVGRGDNGERKKRMIIRKNQRPSRYRK
jgi:hypothetical protein